MPKLVNPMNRRKKRARANTMIRPKKPTRNWLDLPPDILSMILMQLDAIEILSSVQFVCSSWYNICKQPHLWRVIQMFSCPRDNSSRLTNDEYQIMLKSALRRSCGQAVHVTIFGFGTDPLLQYISLISRQIRRLCDDDYSQEEGLTQAEKLERIVGSLNADNLANIGLHCPLLKTLKLKKVFRVPTRYGAYSTRRSSQHVDLVDGCDIDQVDGCDMEAFAIAKTMPKLRHLEIIGNTLSDSGLDTILDGCPDLEYLDLTDCDNLTFRGQWRQKCAERTITLKVPCGI